MIGTTSKNNTHTDAMDENSNLLLKQDINKFLLLSLPNINSRQSVQPYLQIVQN